MNLLFEWKKNASDYYDRKIFRLFFSLRIFKIYFILNYSSLHRSCIDAFHSWCLKVIGICGEQVIFSDSENTHVCYINAYLVNKWSILISHLSIDFINALISEIFDETEIYIIFNYRFLKLNFFFIIIGILTLNIMCQVKLIIVCRKLLLFQRKN